MHNQGRRPQNVVYVSEAVSDGLWCQGEGAEKRHKVPNEENGVVERYTVQEE